SKRLSKCTYVIASRIMREHSDICYERLSAEHQQEPRQKGSPEWWFWRWGCIAGLSEDKKYIHTGNSAYGALGFAYHMGAMRALLVGIDATNDERVEGGRPNNLSHLPILFQSALDQIDIASAGKLEGIKNMSVSEGIEWLRS